MRIIGLGVDLADVDRVERVLGKYPRFAERCFTEHEREYAFRFANPARRFAARFAGKEAVMKSMGTGWRRIRWRDIEITGGGKPTVRMSGNALRRADMLGVTEVMV
ncbi:MAG: holo-ACP synthase, partial [Acidimicrobiia bacterium]